MGLQFTNFVHILIKMYGLRKHREGYEMNQMTSR